MTKKSSQKNKSPKKELPKRRIKPLQFCLLGIGIILIAIAVSQIAQRLSKTTGPTELPNIQAVVTVDTSEPEESKPNEEQYIVPADMPRSITLPSIESGGLIQQVGINSDNAISVPTNVHFAGWFTGSVKPGDSGLSVIDGHVSGRYNDGIFRNLAKLSTGDTFYVEYGDTTRRSFEVVEIKTLPQSQSALFLLTKRDDIVKQLNLITCGGRYDESQQTFDDRVIVVSRALE